ncbi:MAG: 4-hydroxy-tetrahydrodipicolinate reductase [Synergistaceae bacterium]|nr:4-hydroxy-tetrahydrodipicolinate reductase [Synergistaceae bacterium]
MKVFVSGASGNVGKTIVRSIQTQNGFELVGGWCKEAGQDLGTLAGSVPLGIIATDDLVTGLAAAKPDIVIDFSATPVLEGNMKTYLEFDFNVVIGTTGLTEEQFEPFKKAVKEKGLRWAAIANYGLGISFVQDFIKKVSEFYPYVSIIDRHSYKMANAPSGTAAVLAHAASKTQRDWKPGKETYPGVMGAEIAGVQVISQRMPWPGPYSEHEVMLARQDEIIRITVEDHTSEIYMDGIFLTARKLPMMPAGTFIRDLSEVR